MPVSKPARGIAIFLVMNIILLLAPEFVKAGSVEDTNGKTTFYGVFVG